MDWKEVRSITIDCLALDALLQRQTNNPIAEAEWAQNFQDAIRAGVEVIVTDPTGGKGQLVLIDGKLMVVAN